MHHYLVCHGAFSNYSASIFSRKHASLIYRTQMNPFVPLRQQRRAPPRPQPSWSTLPLWCIQLMPVSSATEFLQVYWQGWFWSRKRGRDWITALLSGKCEIAPQHQAVFSSQLQIRPGSTFHQWHVAHICSMTHPRSLCVPKAFQIVEHRSKYNVCTFPSSL